MANPSISQIKVNNVTYDVKDPNAFRVTGDAAINSFSVSSSVPTITLKSSAIDISTNPADSLYAGFILSDANNNSFGRFRGYQAPSGTLSVEMIATNENDVSNIMRMSVMRDGTRSVYFNDPGAFRSGLGITDSGWISKTNSSVFTNNPIYVRKVFNMVEIMGFSVHLTNEFSSGSSITLFTFSNDDYKPTYTVTIPAGSPSANDGVHGNIVIPSNGNVNFYRPSGTTWTTSMNINFHGMFFV